MLPSESVQVYVISSPSKSSMSPAESIAVAVPSHPSSISSSSPASAVGLVLANVFSIVTV